jgi:hypothetical protein
MQVASGGSGGFSGSAAQAPGPSTPAAAPQSAPNLRVVQPQSGQASQASQGGADEFRELYEQTRSDFEGFRNESSRTLNHLRKTTDTQGQMLSKLRQVFSPEESQPKPQDKIAAQIAEKEKLLDYYIQQGFEADKNGTPIPLTIDNGIRQLQAEIRYLQESGDMRGELEQLKARLQQATSPDHQLNQSAYQNLDGFLIKSLETMYGPGQEHGFAKAGQWQSCVGQMKNIVQDLQKNTPEVWDQVRRSPEKLQRLVHHVVTQNMPPKARQIIETERLRSEPITEGELWTAFNQAKTIQDPAERKRWTDKVRQQIIAMKFNNKRPDPRYRIDNAYRGA